MLHNQIKIDNRFSALLDLRWFRSVNRLARKMGIKPYSRVEVRKTILTRYGWN